MSDAPRITRSMALGFIAAVLVASLGTPTLHAQGGRGRGMGRGGTMGDAAHRADMQLLHALFDNRDRITREVAPRADGVSTLTESDDPAVATMIQEHVGAMSARVKEARPIHQRDPLFRAIFSRAGRITMSYEPTPRGVRVVETSGDPCTVKLIQAHAEVVSAFLANGRAEAMRNHPVPEGCR